jgi:lysozyme family protein
MMADVKAAVMAVLRQEDSTLSGLVTDIPGDSGGVTRFGLASRWHPELSSTTFYSTMSNSDALQVAVNTLTVQYAEPLGIGDINDQALATKVLSYGVNEDPKRAAEALQVAVNELLPDSPVTVDGAMGPWTIAAVNRCMPVSLLLAFKLQMIERYAEHAKDNVLRGLVNRALA